MATKYTNISKNFPNWYLWSEKYHLATLFRHGGSFFKKKKEKLMLETFPGAYETLET
jgi:hypothetical protein